MSDADQRHFRGLCCMLNDALDHARDVAARAQEATEGTIDTLMFDAARKALIDFMATNPAIVTLNRVLRGLI